jgi:putative transposase
MATSMVLDAIEQAIWTRQQEGVMDLKDVVHHTGRGSPVHVDPVQRTPRRSWDPTLGGSGRQLLCRCLAEMIDGLYRTELIRPRKPWRTIEEVELATAEPKEES